jgi:TldD protein
MRQQMRCHPQRSAAESNNLLLRFGCHPERSAAESKDLHLSFTRISKMICLPALLMLILSAAIPIIAFAQPTRTEAEKDPVLKAMIEELDRSMASLQLPGFQKPFFIQYRIAEVSDFETRAAFGASQGAQHSHSRIARITVRVGDYKTDSSTARGDGSFELTALDDDPVALRSTLWNSTDQAYKAALAAYAQKQAELKQVQTSPQADDFSQEKPLVSLATPPRLAVDESSWTDRVARDSGLYRADPSVSATQHDVQYSSAAFHARIITTWLVSSEGSIVRKSASSYQESIGVGTQAADGMHLDRSYASTGIALTDLDSPEAFRQQTINLIESLADLRKAPLVDEEYHGPVLLSSDAAADTMRSLLAAGIGATRPRLGTGARTNGPFASSLHGLILPESFDVIDDPTLRTLAGKNLIGSYDVDDEGVAAQPVKLVASGRLDNYLIGRVPVRDFPQSNGHGRAGVAGPARPAVGVLKVTTQNGLSNEELNARLLALAKDRGLKGAYFVSTLGPEATPRLLFRINLDGNRELVRGAVLDDLDQRSLRSSITAAGKDLWVANYSGEIPTTVLAPALLFSDITIRRANEKNDKLPFYPPPD